MKKRILFLIKYLFLAIAASVIIIPFWMMIINSFKNSSEARAVNLNFPEEFVGLDNYREIISSIPFLRIFFNSLLITLISTLIILIISSMAAYIISRRKDRISGFFFYFFLIGMVFPPSAILTVMVLKYLNILGTYQGMIFFYCGILISFPFFLLTNFMATIPRDLEEAALIDGATPIAIYFRIIIPLLKPALVTIFIWCFMVMWNDFMYPLYILAGNTEKYTIVLSLYRYKSLYRTEWNLVFSLLILISIPTIIAFIIAQKRIAEGMTAGAIKG